jgi:hypothetical protein
MNHIILINIRLEDSRPINQADNLLYITRLTTITKGVTNASYPEGRLNLLPSIREKQSIATSIRDSNINSEFLGDNGFNLPHNPQYTPSETNSNPTSQIDSNDRATLIRTLASKDEGVASLLNEAFREDSWREFREKLISCIASAGGDESIRMVISTNDFRVESLPFRFTEFITRELGLGNRHISIKFAPPTEGYLPELRLP